MHAKNSPWHAIGELEDIKAVLNDIETHLAVIRVHAKTQSGNWTQVLIEVERARPKLRAIKQAHDECWERLYHIAMYNGLPREDEPQP